ncbi:putative major facilitator superfamily transporter [Aureobasidium pullulans]|nr:putative major facilitator superfamily transporter [Aureobasidium pullulans]
MERSTHSSGTEAGFTTTTEPAMPRDTILSETTPSGVPLEHLQIAEKHTTDQPLQEELADDDPYNGRSKSKVAVTMLALCTAVFLGTLDSTIVTTALPTITEHFNSASGYTWIGSAFLLANASTIPSWGKASDIFGRKPMLLLANVVFMIGSLVAALSNSVGMLVVARAVQGLGSGGLVIVNITIGDLFSLRTRGVFYGILGGVWASASSIGPIVGGLLTQCASWRWCFWINLPLDGLAFIVLFFCLDTESPKTPLVEGLKAIDWIGSFLVIGATLMFLFGIQYGGETYP